MDRQYLGYSLELHHDVPVHYKVETVPMKRYSAVRDWDRHLPLKRQSTRLQLDDHRGLIDNFKKPRPERSMNGNCRADDLARELLMLQNHVANEQVDSVYVKDTGPVQPS